MATLNAQSVNSSDDADDVVGSAIPKDLRWDWHTWPNNLRRAIGVSLTFVVSVLLFIWFLQSLDTELMQKLNTDTGLKATAMDKLRDSGKERDAIVKELPTLRELETLGIFGEEKRLEWVELLRSIEKRWPGIAIQYVIAPQTLLLGEGAGAVQPIPAGAKLPNGDPVKQFGVFSTDMRLTLQLLHEGDVFAIFDELKAANLGLFTVKKCIFKRSIEAANLPLSNDIRASVGADCTLTWVSMSTYQ